MFDDTFGGGWEGRRAVERGGGRGAAGVTVPCKHLELDLAAFSFPAVVRVAMRGDHEGDGL